MNKIEGIIFDMDGLLFDTERIYYEAAQEIADQLKLPYSIELYRKFIGISDEEVYQKYNSVYKDFGKQKINLFFQLSYFRTYMKFLTGKVAIKRGAVDLLKYLHEKNIPCLIASSNNRAIIELLLETANIRNYFIDVISCEDVICAKPNPEIYKRAVDHLHADPKNILVLEDSFNGVRAAYSAKVPVLMVPDLLNPTKEMEDKTIKILKDLKEVLFYLQSGLIA